MSKNMQFYHTRHRTAPTIIIVALIDILIVLLIFLIVTTTFKTHPAVKLNLPESKEIKEGVSTSTGNYLTISIDKKPPYFYLDGRALTQEQLEAELKKRASAKNINSVTIEADALTPFEQIIKAIDCARAANLTNFAAFVKKQK
jgi:biopolymer transport protein ExbD